MNHESNLTLDPLSLNETVDATNVNIDYILRTFEKIFDIW